MKKPGSLFSSIVINASLEADTKVSPDDSEYFTLITFRCLISSGALKGTTMTHSSPGFSAARLSKHTQQQYDKEQQGTYFFIYSRKITFLKSNRCTASTRDHRAHLHTGSVQANDTDHGMYRLHCSVFSILTN